MNDSKSRPFFRLTIGIKVNTLFTLGGGHIVGAVTLEGIARLPTVLVINQIVSAGGALSCCRPNRTPNREHIATEILAHAVLVGGVPNQTAAYTFSQCWTKYLMPFKCAYPRLVTWVFAVLVHVDRVGFALSIFRLFNALWVGITAPLAIRCPNIITATLINKLK